MKVYKTLKDELVVIRRFKDEKFKINRIQMLYGKLELAVELGLITYSDWERLFDLIRKEVSK